MSKRSEAILLKDTQDLRHTDFRQHPELYCIGKGEQGVLSVEPYKSEILPYWRFKTVAEAQASADKIHALYQDYKQTGDFVGMNMVRKFLQMGYTRARRYANHPSGRKYAPEKSTTDSGSGKAEKRKVLPQSADWDSSEKAQAARIFYGVYERVKDDPDYQQYRQEHLARYGK